MSKIEWRDSPSFFFLNFGQELLVGDGLVELSASGGCHLLQLKPDVVELLQAVVDLGATELGGVDQGLASILDGLEREKVKKGYVGPKQTANAANDKNIEQTILKIRPHEDQWNKKTIQVIK